MAFTIRVQSKYYPQAEICTVFTPKRQSPTEHLKVLRHPSPEFSNTTPYLSPALHNASDTWVRYLRTQVHLFMDEFGDYKNQHLLMGKSVQERKEINEWCNNLKEKAKEFIITVYDDEVAAKEELYLAAQADNFASQGWSANYEYGDGQFNSAINNLAEYFEVQEAQVNGGVDDWSANFKFPDEDVELSGQQQADDDEDLCVTPRSTSSCSSLSTEYDPIFDEDENSYSEDEIITNSSCDGALEEANEYVDSTQASCTMAITDGEVYLNEEVSPNKDISPKEEVINGSHGIQVTSSASESKKDQKGKEKKRQRRLVKAERLLSSAWRYLESDGKWLTQCSWLPIKSNFRPETVKEIASESSVPFIQLTTPEGEVCELIECQQLLPEDYYEYVIERQAAQARLARRVKKYRDKYETYSEYCRRLKKEEWWRTKEKETAKEMMEQEAILSSIAGHDQ